MIAYSQVIICKRYVVRVANKLSLTAYCSLCHILTDLPRVADETTAGMASRWMPMLTDRLAPTLTDLIAAVLETRLVALL